MGSKERNSTLVQGRVREGTQSKEMSEAIGGAWVGVHLRVRDASVRPESCRPHSSPFPCSPSSRPGQSVYSPSARPAGRADGSTWQTAEG